MGQRIWETDEREWGGSEYVETATAVTVTPALAHLWTIRATGASARAGIPTNTYRTGEMGAPFLRIICDATSTHSLAIGPAGAGDWLSITAGDVVEVCSGQNGYFTVEKVLT